MHAADSDSIPCISYCLLFSTRSEFWVQWNPWALPNVVQTLPPKILFIYLNLFWCSVIYILLMVGFMCISFQHHTSHQSNSFLHQGPLPFSTPTTTTIAHSVLWTNSPLCCFCPFVLPFGVSLNLTYARYQSVYMSFHWPHSVIPSSSIMHSLIS